VKTGYNLVKDAYEGEAVIPLNKRGTKSPEKLSVGNPICEAGLAILVHIFVSIERCTT